MLALDDHYKNQSLYRQPLQVLMFVMVMVRVDDLIPIPYSSASSSLCAVPKQ